MGGYDVAFQSLGEIQNPLGLLDHSGVQVGIIKAVAKVAADGGVDQAVGLRDIQRFLYLRVAPSELRVADVLLYAINSQGCGLFHTSTETEAEGFNHCTNFHVIASLSLSDPVWVGSNHGVRRYYNNFGEDCQELQCDLSHFFVV